MRRKNPKKPQGENNKNRPWYEPIKKVCSFLGKITANQVLAFTTAIIAGFAVYQAWIARDTERRELRAYISVDIDTLIITGKKAVGNDTINYYIRTLHLQNTGQTPAYGLATRYRTDFAFLSYGNKLPPIPINTKDASTTTIGTGTYRLTISTGKEITRLEAGAILDSIAALFTWGEITYKDAFGDRHFTRFKYAYVISPSAGRAFTIAWPTGNESN